MKTLALLLFLAPVIALACKPAGVPDCSEKDRVLLRGPSLESLETSVRNLQKTLDAAIPAAGPKDKRSSCFNNKFSLYYIEEAKAHAAKHKKLFCPAYLDAVERNVKDLIDPNSREWKSVADAKFKPMLEADAKAVKKALDEFLAAHSK